MLQNVTWLAIIAVDTAANELSSRKRASPEERVGLWPRRGLLGDFGHELPRGFSEVILRNRRKISVRCRKSSEKKVCELSGQNAECHVRQEIVCSTYILHVP